MNDRIAVLIPCFNEGHTIYGVVREFSEALPGADIYVYDNNSTDNTADEARRAGATVRREPMQGKGNVVRTMLRDVDADCYLMVDGDATYPAAKAAEICKGVLSGDYDMVIGDRLSSTYFTENKRRFHNSGNVLVRYLINKIFRSDVKDIMTGYRAIGRRCAKCMPVLSKGFEIETEMTIFALDNGYRIGSVEIDYKDRPAGSTSKLNTFADGYRVIKTIFRLFRDYKPFFFFSIVALILFVLSSVVMIPVIHEYMVTGLVPRFPTLIVCCFVMLMALLLWMCGIVLEVQLNHHRQIYELICNQYKDDVSRR